MRASDAAPATDYRILANATSMTVDPIDTFANDVLIGLSERPKRLPAQYFYDDAGSRLFQRIMGLAEYYPTRCETEILTRHSTAIGQQLGAAKINLVDLGAGDGAKTVILLRQLRDSGIDVRYVPIDISEEALRMVTARVRRELPEIDVAGLVADYATGLHWLRTHDDGRANLVCLLGSNIGNFNKPRARVFLRSLWRGMSPRDALLVGFDLKKDIDLLLAAYNDPHGVTAAFNLNLLTRMNRELGAHFDLETFRHYGTYDVHSGAMVSYLVSQVAQEVSIDHLEIGFEFDAWEPVHTEYSYKYLASDIEALARDTGFAFEADYYDERGWFVDSLWRPKERYVAGAVPAAM